MYPIFPVEFVDNACPHVKSAKREAKRNKEEYTTEEFRQFADCEFYSAGAGQMCQSCKLHLTRPFLHHEDDRKYLPLIEEYYRQVEKYDKDSQIGIMHAGEGI